MLCADCSPQCSSLSRISFNASHRGSFSGTVQRTAWLADRFAEMTPAQIGDLLRGISALEQIVEGGR